MLSLLKLAVPAQAWQPLAYITLQQSESGLVPAIVFAGARSPDTLMLIVAPNTADESVKDSHVGIAMQHWGWLNDSWIKHQYSTAHNYM